MNTPFSSEEEQKLIDAIAAHRGVTREDAEELLNSVATRAAKRNPVLEVNWVKTLHAVSHDLAAGTATPVGLFVSVFWLRLYGVVTEMVSRFRSMAASHDGDRDAQRKDTWGAAAKAVLDGCVAIRDSLSDDEAVYAAYVRHTHAHVYQSGFELGIERGNPANRQPPRLRRNQMVSTVERHVDIIEVHSAVERVLDEHGRDETRVAAAVATRLLPHIQRLRQAMDLVQVERKRDAESSRRAKRQTDSTK